MTSLTIELMSGKIKDDDYIYIKDEFGWLASGRWFQDNILAYADKWVQVKRNGKKVTLTLI